MIGNEDTEVYWSGGWELVIILKERIKDQIMQNKAIVNKLFYH